MRLLAFTLLAIAAGVGIQWGLSDLPLEMQQGMGRFMKALMFLLPMIATAGLAYAMRISNIIYVYFAVILSPFVAMISIILFAMFVLHDNGL